MAIEPEGAILRKIVRQGFDFASKAHAALSGRRNAFGLSGTDAFPFILGNERKHLQDQIGNECSEQVFVPPGVEQGHVQDENVHALFLGQHAPLFQNLLIIAAEPVNTGDAELLPGLSFLSMAECRAAKKKTSGRGVRRSCVSTLFFVVSVW